MRVLVVDDNEDIAFLHCKLAEVCGCETRFSVSPLEALDVAGEWQPHVILLDLAMPGIDGYKLAPKLREVSNGSVPRILLISGYVPDEPQMLEAGIDGHLLKPVDLYHLNQILTL
jgi:CheY-like chemotaxis protein